MDVYARLGLPCSIEGITSETYKRARDEIVVHRDGLLRAPLPNPNPNPNPTVAATLLSTLTPTLPLAWLEAARGGAAGGPGGGSGGKGGALSVTKLSGTSPSAPMMPELRMPGQG